MTYDQWKTTDPGDFSRERRCVMAASKTWRCFHCGDVFRNPRHAAAHFGYDELQEPGCVAVLRHGESHLLDRIRDLQERLHRYENDDSDIIRWANTKAADHAAALRTEEEKGYARGLRDAGYTEGALSDSLNSTRQA